MKKNKDHILFVEDSKIDQMTFIKFATDTAFPYTYDFAESISEADQLLEKNHYDIVIMDFMLGDGTAFNLIDKLNDIPFIIVTGAGNEEIAVQAMKLGASDYLIKGSRASHLKTLPMTLKNILAHKQSEKELDHYRKNLKKMIKERTQELQKEIGQRKKAQKKLQQTTRELKRYVEELELFLHISSHDLQEPLHTISNYVQLLAKKYRNKLNKDADDIIEYAVEGVKRMQSIIDDLILYSTLNKEAQSITTINFNTLVQNVLNSFSQQITKDGIKLNVNDLPTLKADKKQIALMFQNLIDNAIKFKNQQKHLTIKISAKPQKDAWIFSICDNGIGIHPKYQDRIFILFQRLHTIKKYSGNGIGLTLCKKIIELHNGKIWVESEPLKGSTFNFLLPK